VEVRNERLNGQEGTKLAEELLRALRQEQKLNETKKDYSERIIKQALQAIGLKEELE